MSIEARREASEIAARHLAAGRLAEAAAILEDILRQQPSDTEALCGLGAVLLKRGEPERGFDLIARAVALAPSDATATGNLAIAYMVCGKLPEAEDCARRALDLGPEKPGLHANFASVLSALGKTADALQAQRHAVALAPTSADQRFNLGNVLVAAGRLPAARIEFEAALDRDPDHLGALNNLALLNQQAGRLDPALALLDRARLQDPLNPRLMAHRADVLSRLGRHPEAIETVTRAATLSPKDPVLQRARAAVLLGAGDFAEAGRVLAAVLRGAPNDSAAAGLLATLMRRQGRLYEAQVVIDHARSGNPGPCPLDPVAVELLLLRGRYSDAWALLNGRADGEPSPVSQLAGDARLEGRHIRLVSLDSTAALFATLFLPSLKARGAVLTVVCPPILARLFETLAAVDAVVPMSEIDLSALLQEGVVTIPLDHLPHLLQATPEIPAVAAPLFDMPPAAAGTTPGATGGIGLWWEGPGPGGALAEALSRTGGATIVSLQTGPASNDAREVLASDRFVDRGAAISDFHDLAQEILALDRVIAPDGPVAHLAAALGVETWVLVGRDGSWPWHGDPESPWYPSSRVFRQSTDGSWDAALAAICRSICDGSGTGNG